MKLKKLAKTQPKMKRKATQLKQRQKIKQKKAVKSFPIQPPLNPAKPTKKLFKQTQNQRRKKLLRKPKRKRKSKHPKIKRKRHKRKHKLLRSPNQINPLLKTKNQNSTKNSRINPPLNPKTGETDKTLLKTINQLLLLPLALPLLPLLPLLSPTLILRRRSLLLVL